MSELQLSLQLVRKVQEAVVSADERAKDPMIAVQYVAAVMGFMVGRLDLPAEAQRETIEQLGDFAQHVAEQSQPKQAPPESAFGVWRPGDN
ncbi:hypothetical protein HUS23_09345 [Ectothiorhodospiraceae bacterium 2226]|nr:hypothetical protein HUS23_09345 [Ectothiorhodospiraceae bacterium 2226]